MRIVDFVGEISGVGKSERDLELIPLSLMRIAQGFRPESSQGMSNMVRAFFPIHDVLQKSFHPDLKVARTLSQKMDEATEGEGGTIWRGNGMDT